VVIASLLHLVEREHEHMCTISTTLGAYQAHGARLVIRHVVQIGEQSHRYPQAITDVDRLLITLDGVWSDHVSVVCA
jgi:hypothetical protein